MKEKQLEDTTKTPESNRQLQNENIEEDQSEQFSEESSED